MKISTLVVAGLIIFASESSVIAATPVTYIYNSGAYFTGGLYDGIYSPVFGNNYNAIFTFSDDVSHTAPGLQCLYATYSSDGCLPTNSKATLLNWAVSFGSTNLNATNAHISSLNYNYYNGAPYGNQQNVKFNIVEDNPSRGLSLSTNSEGASNRTGDFNVIYLGGGVGAGGYQAQNTGGYGSATSSYNYTGPGGQTTSGAPGGGGTGTGTGTGGGATPVPEPNGLALFALGAALLATVTRKGSRLKLT